MIQIIPAILAASEKEYEENLNKLSKTPSLAEGWVHFDFMDNKFVQNKSIDPLMLAKYPVHFQKEAHLMVEYPKDWISKLIKVGFRRIFFHLESQGNLEELIDYIKKRKLEVGLVLKHETPLNQLESFIPKIDSVILMSVAPGFQGQPFIKEVLDKITDFKSRGWSVKLGVDGAVKDNNIKKLSKAGVDFVIVGSYLLNGDIDENLERLWEILGNMQ